MRYFVVCLIPQNVFHNHSKSVGIFFGYWVHFSILTRQHVSLDLVCFVQSIYCTVAISKFLNKIQSNDAHVHLRLLFCLVFYRPKLCSNILNLNVDRNLAIIFICTKFRKLRSINHRPTHDLK